MTNRHIILNILPQYASIIVISCLFSIPSFAQNDKIKELENILKESNTDTARINTLNALSYEYYRVDIEKTYYYGELALNQSKLINYQKGISQALNYLSIAYAVEGDQQKSIDINEESLKIARELNNPILMANALNDIGISYNELGFTDKALSYYLESLSYSKISDKKLLECLTLGNIGNLYALLNDKEKAANYFNQSAEIAKKCNNQMVKYLPDLNLGNLYLDEGNYELAHSHFELSLSKATDDLSKSEILFSIAESFKEQKRYKEALKKSETAISLTKKIGNAENMPYNTFLYARLLYLDEQFDASKQQIKSILDDQKYREVSLYTIRDLYELQGNLFLKLKDFQSAAGSFKKVTALQDSIFNTEKLSAISGTEAKFQIKEKENTLLRIQQEQSQMVLAQKNKTFWLVAILLLLVSSISLLLFRAFQNKQKFNSRLQQEVDSKTVALLKSNKQLKTSNVELERFAYIASHDLKEPLRNISSFSSLVQRELELSEYPSSINEYMSFIRTNTVQMHNLIEDVLEFSKLDGTQAIREQVSIYELLTNLKKTLQTSIEQERVIINIPNHLPILLTSRVQLLTVFKNLISNGIKYNQSKQPIIKIEYTEIPGFHKFSVIDNGLGIPRVYKKQIFEMFKRLHTRTEYQGTGLGLAICKKIICKMGGEIWLEEVSEGSVFSFTIPQK